MVCNIQYSRLACLNLESLQIRRLKCDLLLCYKIIHNKITIVSDDFLVFSDFTRTRRHCYKLFKGCSRVNAHKYFFSNRITEIWNALPSAVVDDESDRIVATVGRPCTKMYHTRIVYHGGRDRRTMTRILHILKISENRAF